MTFYTREHIWKLQFKNFARPGSGVTRKVQVTECMRCGARPEWPIGKVGCPVSPSQGENNGNA